MQAIITVGIPGSGKSTKAKELCKSGGWVNLNRDDIRFSLFGASTWHDYKFTRAKEDMVTDVQTAMAESAAKQGKNVIISDTNLNEKVRERWEYILTKMGYKVSTLEFPTSLEVAYKNDQLRENGVGRDVIYRMYKKWREYKGLRLYEPNKSLPKAVLVDLDGTLASMEGIRSPYEWDKVGLDKPRPHVVDMVKGFESQGYAIVVMSGRDGCCYKESKEWLTRNGIVHHAFHMRPAGNKERDTVIKERIFWKDIEPNWNIVCAIDDRPSVIRKWLEIGLNVVSVGDPYLEF